MNAIDVPGSLMYNGYTYQCYNEQKYIPKDEDKMHISDLVHGEKTKLSFNNYDII